MKPDELQIELARLLALPVETECVEFKEAKNNFDLNDLGKYFSAISNEANLKGLEFGWLVFGVKDNPRSVVGTNFRPSRPALDSLKQEVAAQANHLSFIEIYELNTEDGRVVMFQIPAAAIGIPTPWKGYYHGRNGESLAPLSIAKQDHIRKARRGQLVNPIPEKVRTRRSRAFRNPYDFNHIASREIFKGRVSEIGQLLDNVSSGTHTAVFGLQRVGKTSLVEYAMEEALQGKAELRKEVLYAKIDFQHTNYSKYRDLFDLFLRAVASVFRSELVKGRADTIVERFTNQTSRPELRDRKLLFQPFAAALKNLVDIASGKKVVLFLDEFSEWCRVVEGNQATPHRLRGGKSPHPHESLVDIDLMQFFSSLLRSEDLKGRLVFIFAVRPFMAEYDNQRNLQILKLCSPLTLYHLEEPAAKALCTEPIRDHLKISQDAVDYLCGLTAGHPYLIQFILKMVIDPCLRSGCQAIKLENIKAAEEKMASEGPAYKAQFKVLDSDYSVECVLSPERARRGQGLLALIAKSSNDSKDGWTAHKSVAESMSQHGCVREETDCLLEQLVNSKILEERETGEGRQFRMAVPLLSKRYLKQNFYLRHFHDAWY